MSSFSNTDNTNTKPTNNNILCTSFDDINLEWYNEPTSWNRNVSISDQDTIETTTGIDSTNFIDTSIIDTTNTIGIIEGSGGSYQINNHGKVLILYPPAKKDFWSKTFYNPILIKNDASGLLYNIPINMESTIKIDFKYEAYAQFDQAGLLIYIDNNHWVKAGIEYCDGAYKLSVVVCNDGYSDWSTQPWNNGAAKLRIHKVNISDSIVVEAAPYTTNTNTTDTNVDYQSIRIAHLSIPIKGDTDSTSTSTWRIGPFAACPTAQLGCHAEFTSFHIGPLEQTTHSDVI